MSAPGFGVTFDEVQRYDWQSVPVPLEERDRASAFSPKKLLATKMPALLAPAASWRMLDILAF
jgi:hypothetical protein